MVSDTSSDDAARRAAAGPLASTDVVEIQRGTECVEAV
jgi:hypothetical protein